MKISEASELSMLISQQRCQRGIKDRKNYMLGISRLPNKMEVRTQLSDFVPDVAFQQKNPII